MTSRYLRLKNYSDRKRPSPKWQESPKIIGPATGEENSIRTRKPGRTQGVRLSDLRMRRLRVSCRFIHSALSMSSTTVTLSGAGLFSSSNNLVKSLSTDSFGRARPFFLKRWRSEGGTKGGTLSHRRDSPRKPLGAGIS